MITLYFRAVDDPEGWTRDFYTAEKAVAHFRYQMGKCYDIGSSYAVNSYGDLTCSIEGATWRDLGLE